MWPGARPQARKKQEVYSLEYEYIEDFFEPRTMQMAEDRSPSRTVNVGQTPKNDRIGTVFGRCISQPFPTVGGSTRHSV